MGGVVGRLGDGEVGGWWVVTVKCSSTPIISLSTSWPLWCVASVSWARVFCTCVVLCVFIVLYHIYVMLNVFNHTIILTLKIW